MDIFLSVVHAALCFFMILVILLQPGREGGMGGAFGGGAATSAFGGQGATTFLSKVTAGCAVAFFLTSLMLSFVGHQRSVVAGHKAPLPAVTAPADAETEEALETFVPMEEAELDAAEPDTAEAPEAEAPADPTELPVPSAPEAEPADPQAPAAEVPTSPSP